VAAHVESPEGVRVALENGVDTVEHGAKLDDNMIRLFKERGASPVCTISPALPYAVFDLSESHAPAVAKKNGKIVMDGIIECARTCRENGIPVGLGNDVGCPFIVHYNFWRELCYYHKYVGASNEETLHTATMGNAQIAGIDNETGSLEKGKSADLIVVKENPLEDLTALRNVSMVMVRGRLIRNPKVKRMKYVDDLLDRYM
jgi:imidazolonepropionase-like amidohydrolase